jgi:O-antigen/teichoic acid export membrane protein
VNNTVASRTTPNFKGVILPSTSPPPALLLQTRETAAANDPKTATAPGKTLEAKAVQATFWTVVDYGSATGLRIVNSLILTRLLRPELFGLMTLVTTLIVGIGLFSDIGLAPSVIQSPYGDDRDFLNTVWTLQIIRSAAISVVAIIMAWPMALFYHDSRIVGIVIVLSLSILVSGFYSSNLLSLSRHLGVRRLFIFDFSAQFVTMAAAITWALLVGRTIWALVAGNCASVVFRIAASYFKPLVPGIRNRFCWDRKSVQSLFHFGKWILLGTAASFFASQSDRLILGKLVSLTLLGVYGIAYSISDIPRAVINAFSQKVGYPFVAKMTHLPIPEFRKMFLQYRSRVLVLGALLLTLMVHLGGFLVSKMYDSRYHAASWMVPVLALGLWHTLMYATTQPVLYCYGKSNYQAIGNVFYCSASISSIPLAFHFWGMIGAVVAVAASDFPMYLTILIGASRQRISTWRQDLVMTVIFLSFLGIGFAIRRSIFG